jgi:hypothetical protein
MGGLDASFRLAMSKLSLSASPRLKMAYLLLKKEPSGYKRHMWSERIHALYAAKE